VSPLEYCLVYGCTNFSKCRSHGTKTSLSGDLATGNLCAAGVGHSGGRSVEL
jgi:hypothetical protein